MSAHRFAFDDYHIDNDNVNYNTNNNNMDKSGNTNNDCKPISYDNGNDRIMNIDRMTRAVKIMTIIITMMRMMMAIIVMENLTLIVITTIQQPLLCRIW